MDKSKWLKLDIQHFGNETTTYDFKKVSVIAAGTIITGWMDGDAIQSEKNEDDVTPHVGAGGDVTFAESTDETGTITLTLKSTSSSIPILKALRDSKEMFQLQIVDVNDNAFRAGGSECRIVKPPARTYGTEVTGTEWAIYVADYKEA
ncbi:phage structural protein [Sporosarcina sp. FSL K6-1508]|uniref:phage structural protein n=1 Tax=Sporosarcina sp. FSL K6-1508 TaxID=2921553 RepID=UPI0030FAC426